MNIDGIQDDPESLKLEEIIRKISQHHIIALCETRTTNISRLLQFLPQHTLVGNTRVLHNGRKGQGVALLSSKALADCFTVLSISETTQTIYARCEPSFFNKDQPVIFAVTYIAPEQSEDRHSITSQYLHLGQELQHYLLHYSPNIILCGDFNAHVGNMNEITNVHFDIFNDCPLLSCERKTQNTHVNRAGQYLIHLAASQGLIVTTGRVPGDRGQPTFIGYNKLSNTRPDHILVSKSMFVHVKKATITRPKLLDHCYLTMSLSMTSNIPGVDTRLHHQSIYGPHPNFLRWKPERSQNYVDFLEQDTMTQQQLSHAIESKNIEEAWSKLKKWILNAAIQAGMISTTFPNSSLSATRKKPPWFDHTCMAKKRTYLNFVSLHNAEPQTKQQLLHDYRSYVQRCKRHYINKRQHDFLCKLSQNDPSIHSLLKKPAAKQVTPIDADAWNTHLQSVFRPTHDGPIEEHVGYVQPSFTTEPRGLSHNPETTTRRHDNQQPYMSVFNVPSYEELFELISEHVSKMPTSSSSGFDVISSAFIKNARKQVPRQHGRGTEYEHVLTPHITSFFHLLLEQKHIPLAWKEAKLTPIHKKGPVISPRNYRMIAVSAPIYRLYTNVLRSIIQSWCIINNQMPDTQFGFYPGRSTLQPIFILRHLKHAAQVMQTNTSRLFAAFIDFQQAYDSVPRNKLWNHLYNRHMPLHLIHILQDLYHEDEYTLLDGDKMASVKPLYGVKQGCPLSPLLFAIYLNDIDMVAGGVQGASTGLPSYTVTHLLFADDLAFVANKQRHLQTLLDNLVTYAHQKSLVVNTQKSQVICFNSRSDQLPTFYYNGSPLPYTDHFKYLGMLFDKNLNLSTAIDAAQQPLINGTFKIQRFAEEHHLNNRLHALIWLLKTYVIPAGMYASQIWATPFLKQGKEMDNPLQKWILATLKRWLGVRDTTPSWSILRECGLEPLQLNWFRAAIRMYNSFIHCNSDTIQRIVQADTILSSSSSECWSSQVLQAMDGLGNSQQFQRALLHCEPIHLTQFVVDLRTRHASYWDQYVNPSPRDQNSKYLTYHQWSALPFRNIIVDRTPYQLPKYFFLALPHDVLRSIARFRLRVHTLRRETASWTHGSSDHCDVCQHEDSVQDEKHVIFHCTHPSVVALRAKYACLFENQDSQNVHDFLVQDNNKLPFFLHELITFYELPNSRTF